MKIFTLVRWAKTVGVIHHFTDCFLASGFLSKQHEHLRSHLRVKNIICASGYMSKQQKRNKNEEERINRCIKMVNENRIEELTQIKHLQKKLKSNLTPEARLHYNKDPDMGQIKSPSLWTHFVSLSVLYPLSLLPCQPYRCRSIHPLPFIRGRVAVAAVFSYFTQR